MLVLLGQGMHPLCWYVRDGNMACMFAVTPGEGGAEGAAAMEVDADDGDQVDEVPVDVPGPLRGWSLADLAGPPSKQKGFKEEQHMQPLIMGLLKAVAKTVGSDVHLLDTHSSPQLYCPNAKPDCTALANASDVPVWHEVVTTYEFKLGTSVKEQAEAAGQLHHRSAAALNVQPGRRHILGVSISMNTIEVMAFICSRGFATAMRAPTTCFTMWP